MINPPQLHRAERMLSNDECGKLSKWLMTGFPTRNGQIVAHADVLFSPEYGQPVEALHDEIRAEIRRRFEMKADGGQDLSKMILSIAKNPDTDGVLMSANDRDAYMVRICAIKRGE